MKPTTKQCPRCRCTRLRLFPSMNYKQCDNCLHRFDWHLAEGQRPLVGPSADRYIITGDKP
ncbi:hypothetical protein [Halomonas sp. N3-2A]|uniref:hypothetical protein n=1 Tax=Halomonas sp. N3-2A TaxID=2014541 RepID=UPI000B5B3C4A|nr:hypothetical protein [Halomonas sp. N3-2A]ASK18429.1 hypothetical protein CEK60_03505 [Halomonas sp. N3-2A]